MLHLLLAPLLAAAPFPVFVSTGWLASHLKDPDVVVVHVADSFADYRRGHVPGARFLSTRDFVDSSGATVTTELPPAERLVQTFTALGIGNTRRVIIYTTAWPPTAARAYLTLDALGHGARVSLLDGGIEQWVMEDRPVTGAVPKIVPAPFTPKARPAVTASLDDVKRALDGGAVLVDSRPARRYQAGHLPGAKSLYWEDTLKGADQPTLKAGAELKALLEERGIAPGTPIITYCEVGLQASHGYAVLRSLGHEVQMYDGSFQEWTSAGLAVEKDGPAPDAGR